MVKHSEGGWFDEKQLPASQTKVNSLASTHDRVLLSGRTQIVAHSSSHTDCHTRTRARSIDAPQLPERTYALLADRQTLCTISWTRCCTQRACYWLCALLWGCAHAFIWCILKRSLIVALQLASNLFLCLHCNTSISSTNTACAWETFPGDRAALSCSVFLALVDLLEWIH